MAGEVTFGAPQYENEYTYNGESYNPNIRSQYLRARYYCVVTAAFITEDSYLGDISEPLTLNRYNYCLSSYLNYMDPSGFYTSAQGDEAHGALQTEFLFKYPSNAHIEFPVEGYPYSLTGNGNADMVLFMPDGLEVYELKPYWQMHIYNKDGDAIKEYLKYKKDTFLPGWKQREGYISALGDMGYRVNPKGTTFDPNGWILPIVDEDYDYARYFTVPGQPGMIYYTLEKNKGKTKRPVTLPAVMKNIGGKKGLVRCETNQLDPSNSAEAGIAAIVAVIVIALIEYYLPIHIPVPKIA